MQKVKVYHKTTKKLFIGLPKLQKVKVYHKTTKKLFFGTPRQQNKDMQVLKII